MTVALTVGLGATGEVVTTHATLKATTLRRCRDIHLLARFKQFNAQLVAQRQTGAGADLEFREVAQLQVAGGLEVSRLWTIQALVFLKADLDSRVAILLRGPQLRYKARPDLDGSAAAKPTLLIEDLEGAEFSAE